MFTNEQKRNAAIREVGKRKWVYELAVEKKQMTQVKADYEIKIMQEIADDYQALVEKERLL
jgi:hypothetical protein